MCADILLDEQKTDNLSITNLNTVKDQAALEQAEQRLFDAMRESLVILRTSSGDKRVKYRTLFNVLENEVRDGQGINVYFTDSGALNIPPSRTPERQGNYDSHSEEKCAKALQELLENRESIHHQLISSIDHARPLVTMVEDSGWQIAFTKEQYEHPEQVKSAFLGNIVELLRPRFKPEDAEWLFNHIQPNDPDSSFPGPNLKPLQEALTGSFNELMEVIYQAADMTEGMDANQLSYQSNISVAFGVLYPDNTQEIYTKKFNSNGNIISQQRFKDAVNLLGIGESVDSNMIHIPNDQTDNQQLTLNDLREDYLVTHSSKLPFDFERRHFAEWLQEGIGAKSKQIDTQDLHIAYVSAEEFERAITSQAVDREPYEQGLRHILEQAYGEHYQESHQIVAIPTREALRQFPSRKMLNGTDMVILRGCDETITDEGLIYDPNLMLTDYMVVNTQTDPLSMTVPIILDNRDGKFDRTLRIFKDAYQSGRMMGEFPLLVANDDASLQRIITEQTQAVQLSKVIDKTKDSTIASGSAAQDVSLDETISVDMSYDLKLPKELFHKKTVFVAGGHNNNSLQDKEEAFQLGYMLAKEGVTIVTGGGQLEGSMGSVHTGFIQYHLEQILQRAEQNPALLDNPTVAEFNALMNAAEDTKLNAASLIEHHGDLINGLADAGHIPKHKFFAYSTDPLMKIESPNGMDTVGVDYTNTINRIPRLDALLAPKTMIFLPGGIGTDEEILHTIKQQLVFTKALVNSSSQTLAANDEDIQLPKLIIYNRSYQDIEGVTKGQIDGFLTELGIYQEQEGAYTPNEAVCDAYNITVLQSEQTAEQTVENITKHALTAIKEIKAHSKGITHTQMPVQYNIAV